MTQHEHSVSCDVVLCIDGTRGMRSCIDSVKARAKSVPDMLIDAFDQHMQRPVGQFRARVIVFRDYARDGGHAMVESDFFDLNDPLQLEACRRFVDGIEPSGKSMHSNALEAIVLALRSKWDHTNRIRRHAIFVFTNSAVLPLQDPRRCRAAHYPPNMPRNLQELEELVERGDQETAPAYSPNRTRLLVQAPLSAASQKSGLLRALFTPFARRHKASADIWNTVKQWLYTWVDDISTDHPDAALETENAMAVLAGDF